ncbi:Fucolectin-1 Precursor [Triplophysa tibetana]|uniref:Fucolectin-1 n=1 Tax=Triplophysa tibetana TaxID=1572043 RepID=A0A5A9PLX2_9TELE|nr:Fucolectin-1 Precursor [Triplophysa tibetana]
MAVPEGDFQAMQQKKRRISRRDDEGGLDSVFEKIEEVVLAAQGLTEVTSAIQELSDIVHQNRKTTLALTEEQSRNHYQKQLKHVGNIVQSAVLTLSTSDRTGSLPNEDILVRDDPISLSYMSAATVESGGRSVVIFVGVPDPVRLRGQRGFELRSFRPAKAGETELLLPAADLQLLLEENLAFKGTAIQSSTYSIWAAQNAIDGVRNGGNPYTVPFCSATSYESDPWWRLDLQDYYDISTVIITARPDGWLDQTSGAEIPIGDSQKNNGNNNPICAVIPDPLLGQTISFSCHGMQGRYVNVVMTGRTSVLSLCEVEVYGDNVAFKGTATQSSIYSANVAQYAIDGKRYGSGEAEYCSVTLSDSNPWWRLDLLDEYEIKTVIITARSDCCADQTNGAEIRIGNSVENNGNNNPICAVTSGFLTGYTFSYTCHEMEGRYVNVVMTGFTNHLSLCEVEVYTTENLAFKGTATQTSVYMSWLAEHAIDGVRYEEAFCSGTTTLSNQWWRLDLLDFYNISTVIITAHNSYLDQINGAEIRIGNSLENNGNNNPICAQISGLQSSHTVTYSCGVMVGRYVNVVMTGRTSFLVLCEVEVFGTGHF